MNDQEAWQAQIGLQDAHRSERYYSWLAERSRWWNVGVSLVTTIGTLVAAVFIGMEFARGNRDPLAVIALISGVSAASASMVGVVFNFSGRSVRAANLAKESSLTIPEWRSLLISANGNASRLIVDLSRRQKEIEAPISSELPLKRGLNKKAEKAAYKAVLYEIHRRRENVKRQRGSKAKNTATE